MLVSNLVLKVFSASSRAELENMNLKGLHLGEKMKYSHGINHKAFVQ